MPRQITPLMHTAPEGVACGKVAGYGSHEWLRGYDHEGAHYPGWFEKPHPIECLGCQMPVSVEHVTAGPLLGEDTI